MRHWGVGFIIAAWLLFASPYFVKGLAPFPSKFLVTFFAPWSTTYAMPVKNGAMPDVITQIYPWKRVTIASWKSGQVPLWNPFSFAGTAQAGNYQSAVFSPVNALFFILPEIPAWSIMILLQPLLAGLFMYLFLRSISRSPEGSVMGSLAFMFCGFIVVWMAYGTLGYAALFLPLALYAVNVYEQGKHPWAGPLLALSIGLSLVSGHFQISLYVLLFTVLYLLFRSFQAKKGIRIFSAVWYIGLGLLFAAPQILPSLSTYLAAVRSSIFQKGEVIPWQYLVTIFSPDFYGNPVTRNDWFGHYAEWAMFIGVAPLIAVIALWFLPRKDNAVKFFSLTAIILFLFALPTPLTDLLYAARIPVLSTSAASRIIILVSFAFAALSAYGIDAIRTSWEKDSYKRILGAVLTVCFSIVAVWGALKLLKPFPAEKLSVAMHNTLLPTFIAVVAVAAIVLGYFVPKRWRRILPYALILIALVDLLRFAGKWMPFDPKEYVYPNVNVLRYVSSVIAPTHARVNGNIGNEVASAFGIPVLEGYDAVYQARYGKFISSATDGKIAVLNRSVVQLDKQGKYTEDILRLLGVRYLMHKVSDGRNTWAYPFWNFPSYRSIWKDASYEVFENDAAYPRAYLASSYTVATQEFSILTKLFAKDIDRRETLVLEEDPVIKPATGAGTATITTYEPTRVAVRVVSQAPKLLFLSDVYDPGWHAAVDGKAAPLYRADYDFRAVSVPAGTHTVTMWYWPIEETIGFIAAGFATLWCIGVLFRRKRI